MAIITNIRVVLRDADMHDFLSEGLTPEQTESAIEQYCQAYANLIKSAYPDATIEVESGDTNGGTFVFVNGAQFGNFGSYGTDDHDEFDGAPQYILDMADALVNDWDWLHV